MSIHEEHERLRTLLESAPPGRTTYRFQKWAKQLFELLEAASDAYPDDFATVFHAEMLRFPELWEASLAEVRTLQALKRATELIPFASFTFTLDEYEGPCSLDLESAQALAGSPSATNLSALRLGGGIEWTLDAWEALVASPNLKNLERLDYVEIDLGQDGIRALATASNWPHLTTLNLNYNTLTADDIEILVSWPHLSRLKTLGLAQTSISPEGVAAIRGIDALEVLNLESNELGEPGAKAVAANPAFANLTTLILSGDPSGGTNALGDEGLAAIANSPHLSNLKALHVGGNTIGDEGVKALANSPYLRNLDILGLGSNHIYDDGVIALARSPILENLWALDLGHNSLSDEAAHALAASPYLSKLQTIRLIWNSITADGALQILNSELLPSLTTVEHNGVHGSKDYADDRWPYT